MFQMLKDALTHLMALNTCDHDWETIEEEQVEMYHGFWEDMTGNRSLQRCKKCGAERAYATTRPSLEAKDTRVVRDTFFVEEEL